MNAEPENTEPEHAELKQPGPDRAAGPLRSYVIRQGRLSKGQKRGLEQILPHFQFPETALSSPQQAFAREQPLILEIGFGMGDSLAEMAVAAPEFNFLGLEVHAPGVGHLMIEAERLQLDNVRVMNHDVWSVLPHLPNDSLSGLQVFFPDPWHKKRHHKRRLINSDFLSCAAQKLKPEGFLHIATDWQPYAEQIYELIEGHADLAHCPPPPRAQTKYERRGLRLGHEVTDIAVIKNAKG